MSGCTFCGDKREAPLVGWVTHDTGPDYPLRACAGCRTARGLTPLAEERPVLRLVEPPPAS